MTVADFKAWIDILRNMFPHAPQFEDAQLMGWYGVFKDCDGASLFRAIPTLAKNCARFPSIKEILEIVEPKVDNEAEGRLIADKIWGAIERFGSLKSKQDLVRTAIGETGWKVVENMGGWRVVCEIASYDNVSTLKAQWRESAKALLDIADIDRRRDSLGLPPSHERQALPSQDEVPDNMKNILAYATRRDL